MINIIMELRSKGERSKDICRSECSSVPKPLQKYCFCVPNYGRDEEKTLLCGDFEVIIECVK